MKSQTKKLMIEQMQEKMNLFRRVVTIDPPTGGWIKAVRTSLNMSLRQCADQMDMAPHSVMDLEKREALGTISLNALRSAAQALNLKLVYGLTPLDESLDAMISKRALEVAKTIVMRTDTSMRLEDQQVKKERLEKDIAELADEIKREMPKYLWD